MFRKANWRILAAGLAAGCVTGLFGGGGGMILVPLLTGAGCFQEEEVFPASIAIILPVCFVCLTMTALNGSIPIQDAIPFLLGSSLGGIAAGLWGRHIPALWLHRGLGILILWGGIRYLC